MKPPTDVSGTDLFRKFCEIPRVSELVPLPVFDKDGEPIGHVRMVILTSDEDMLAQRQAREDLNKLLKETPKKDEIGLIDLHNNILASEVLFRACKLENDINLPFFPTRKDVQRMTSHQVGLLFSNYLTLQTKYGPNIYSMDQPELEAWINKLAEGGESASFLLDRFTEEMQRTLLLSLVYQLSKFKTNITLSGSPSEESETNT